VVEPFRGEDLPSLRNAEERSVIQSQLRDAERSNEYL
jgi:hypothetical protein